MTVSAQEMVVEVSVVTMVDVVRTTGEDDTGPVLAVVELPEIKTEVVPAGLVTVSDGFDPGVVNLGTEV